MLPILIKAGCFVAIIFLGWGLRKIGYFQKSDFTILSKIVLRITLPAAIVSSCAGRQISPSMLRISLLGFGFSMVYVGLGYLLYRKEGKRQQAFFMMNLTGYNIGNFTMPFIQSFLGPVGMLTTSLFDVGNAVVCLGAAYGLAAMVQEGQKFSLKRICGVLAHSAPFIAHITMVTLALLHWNLPGPVVEFAGILGNANPFLAMLMLGVGFNLSGDRAQAGSIVKGLGVRYLGAAVFASFCFFLLPLEAEYRVALVVLCLSPISSAIPAFTAELKGDVGLSSAINSISIVVSLICIIGALLVLL